MDDLRYPIGKFVKPSTITPEDIKRYIQEIEDLPSHLEDEVNSLNDSQLNTPYRDGGWTIRQVVHHYADSHMNSITRFKLALTEDKPTIKPYHEELFAELADGKTLSIESSLMIVRGVHLRWTALLKSMTSADFTKAFIHPERGREMKLDECLALYAWHCRHHVGHIANLKKAKGWI